MGDETPIPAETAAFLQKWKTSVHLSLFQIQVGSAIEAHQAFSRVVDTQITAGLEHWKAKHGEANGFVEALLKMNFGAGRHPFLGRAVYVVAWTAFEDLLGSCVRPVMLKEPQRLLARLKEDEPAQSEASPRKDTPAYRALRKLLSGEKTKDELVAELVEAEVAWLPLNVKKAKLGGLVKYLTRALDVHVDERDLEPIRVVRDLRNAAAHNPEFSPPSSADVRRQLAAFSTAGELLASAIVQRHGLNQV